MLQLVLKDMEEALKSNLRREGDIAWKVSYEVIVLLTHCNGENALSVQDRSRQILESCLASKKLDKKIKIKFGYATYPDEAKNAEELIKKAKGS